MTATKGRPKAIESPEVMWQHFIGYKLSLVALSNNWKKFQYVGKDGERVEDALKVPMTMDGFERYCYDVGFTVEHYFRNDKGSYEDFCSICSRIKKEIREDQIIGGMLGFYNPSITQRLNNLTEKTENKNENINIEVKAKFGSPAVHTPSEPAKDS